MIVVDNLYHYEHYQRTPAAVAIDGSRAAHSENVLPDFHSPMPEVCSVNCATVLQSYVAKTSD